MSGLLLCGRQAVHPYYISELDINVYSIEELSYFLYNHICLIGTEFFNEELIHYIRHELEIPQLAEKLKELIDNRTPLSELVLLVLKDSEYYNEKELKEVAALLQNSGGDSPQRRLKSRADIYFSYNRYLSAFNIYQKITEMKREDGLSREFYGDVLHNMGILFIKFFMFEQAQHYFVSAYEMYPHEKFLRKMVLINLMSGNEKNLLDHIRKYNISEEILKECRQEFFRQNQEVQNQEDYGYDKGMEDTVEKWKAEYRELMV